MSNQLATPDKTASTGGVRPLVKIGGKLYNPATGTSSSSDATSDSSDSKNPPSGDWSFEYRPGEKTLQVLVRSDQSLFLSTPVNGELSMEIDEQGVGDLIAWLYGVKSSIASISTSKPSPQGS